jgi:hypothetical protein
MALYWILEFSVTGKSDPTPAVLAGAIYKQGPLCPWLSLGLLSSELRPRLIGFNLFHVLYPVVHLNPTGGGAARVKAAMVIYGNRCAGRSDCRNQSRSIKHVSLKQR